MADDAPWIVTTVFPALPAAQGRRGRGLVAAGLLLVKEAGGMVSGIREGQDPMESGSVILGNEALFEPFRKVIRG